MSKVGMFEAKTHFSELARRVQSGEEIIVTNRGEPVLKMVPIEQPYNVEDARQAMLRIREYAKAHAIPNLTREEIKSWIEEGRP
jgi:prevent-host-death family protein